MKKRISLLLCALMLLLSVQSACALLSHPLNTQISNLSLDTQKAHVVIVNKSGSGNAPSSPSRPTVKSIACKGEDLDSILSSFGRAPLSRNPSSSPNTIPKALVTDLEVTDNNSGDPVTPENGFFAISIPMNEIASAGTIVQNVQVFHGTRQQPNGGSGSSDPDNEYGWDEIPSALTHEENLKISYSPGAGVLPSPDTDTTTGSPSTDPSSAPSHDPGSRPSSNVNDYKIGAAIPKDAPSAVRSGLNLVFLTDGFSPFIIVWDEIPLYSDVPQTGDSSSSMTWFVLLAASCAALLVLRRRVRRA